MNGLSPGVFENAMGESGEASDYSKKEVGDHIIPWLRKIS